MCTYATLTCSAATQVASERDTALWVVCCDSANGGNLFRAGGQTPFVVFTRSYCCCPLFLCIHPVLYPGPSAARHTLLKFLQFLLSFDHFETANCGRNVKICAIRTNKMHFYFLIYFSDLSSTCFEYSNYSSSGDSYCICSIWHLQC